MEEEEEIAEEEVVQEEATVEIAEEDLAEEVILEEIAMVMAVVLTIEDKERNTFRHSFISSSLMTVCSKFALFRTPFICENLRK